MKIFKCLSALSAFAQNNNTVRLKIEDFKTGKPAGEIYGNKNTNLMSFYDGKSAQPSTSQLMPVPDNTDPLNISLGNPNLNPYFNHNMRLMFRYTNMKTFTSVNAHLNGSMVSDAITTVQWYDQTGARYAIPVNGPATGLLNARIMVNSPTGKSDFSIMSMTNARYNQSVSYIGNAASYL